MTWATATDLILILALITGALFGILGIYQWLTRHHFTKIDAELRWAIVPFALMVIIYLIFDHLLIWNTRPDGSGEPSFPSSHVMLVATVFSLTALILPRYIQNSKLRLALDCLMLILTVLTAVGRVLAGKHWTSDVLGALAFAALFTAVYYYLINKRSIHA